MLSRALCGGVSGRLGRGLLRGSEASPLLRALHSARPRPSAAASTGGLLERRQPPVELGRRSAAGQAQGHGTMFKLERMFALGMLPLFPLAYFVHGGAMDLALALAISLHTHWGVHCVIEDYARPLVIGATAAAAANKSAYLLSVLLLAGLLNFNYNDVGITKGLQLIWSL